MKPQAVGYLRFSSKNQITGSSEQRQEDGFGAFVRRSELVEGPTFWDKGESAYHGQHRSAEFGRLLDECRAKKFPGGSVVWVEDMDRFGRGKLYVVLGDWQAIISAGYKIHVDSLGKTYDNDTPEMELLTVIFRAILAHEESEKKSKRGKKNCQLQRDTNKTIKGTPRRIARCPFWLRVNEAGEYEKRVNEVFVVKEMFRLASLGFGCEKIGEKLGNPTRDCGKKGVRKIAVQHVLRNDAVIGRYHPATRIGKSKKAYTGEVKEGYYPSIISPELWRQVQSGLDARKSQRGRKGKFVTNLFSELFRGDDGLPMHIKVISGNRKWGTKDTKYLRRKTAGPNRTWHYPEIETALLRWLKELKLVGSVSSPIDDYKMEVESLEKKLASLAELQAEYPSKANAIALQKTETRIGELASKIEEENQRMPEQTTLTQAWDVLKELDKAKGEELLELRTRLKMLIRRLVTRIDVAYGVTEKGAKTCRLTIHLDRGEKRVIQFGQQKVIFGKKPATVEAVHVCDTNEYAQEVWRVKAS
jgi:DNA invertase Pin-like site-specific DNA recombinase